MAILPILVCLLATAMAQLDYLNSNCRTCLSVGGRQCLQGGTMNYGTCCNPSTPYHQLSTFCKNQPQDQFCATSTSIKNDALQDFVCPASTNYCPKGVAEYFVEVSEVDRWYFREQVWHLTMPNPKATTWNCKYHIVVDRNLVSSADTSERGYLAVEVELYGFDEEVFVISTPHKKFFDFNESAPNATETRLLKAEFGDIFILPAEDEALISFAPIRNVGENLGVVSPSGKFRMRAKLVPSFTEMLSDPKVKVLKYRAGEEPVEVPEGGDGLEGNSTDPSTIDNPAKNETNGTKVNWDGEVVPEGPWLEKEVITIGEVTITNEDLVVGSSTTLIILLILFAICIYISYRKRQRIAVEMRRASEFIRRTSSYIRNSIRSRGGSIELVGEQHQGIRVVKQNSTSNKKQSEFLRDLFQHQDEVAVKDVHVHGLNSGKQEGKSSKMYRSATIVHGKQDRRKMEMNLEYKSLGDEDTQKTDREGFDIFLGGQYHSHDYEDHVFGDDDSKKRSKTMVVNKGKVQGLQQERKGTGKFGGEAAGDHSGSNSEDNENPFNPKDHAGMNMPSDVISFGNKTKMVEEEPQLEVAPAQSVKALQPPGAGGDLQADIKGDDMVFSSTMKSRKTVKFVQETDGSNSKLDSDHPTEENKEQEIEANSEQPRNFFHDLKAYNTGESSDPTASKDGPGKLRGLTKVNNILAGLEEDLQDEGLMQSIMSQSIVLSQADDRRRDTSGSITKAKFFDLIEQSRNLLGDLREIEQEKETKLQNLVHQISEESLPPPTAMLGDEDSQINSKYMAAAELKTIEEEQSNPNASNIMSSNVHLETQDLLDSNDPEFAEFLKRKDTILTQITDLSRLRYGDDEAKQKQLVQEAKEALEEEKDAYVITRHTIKRRQTQLQQSDFTYKVFRESTKGNEEGEPDSVAGVQFYSGDQKVEDPSLDPAADPEAHEV